MTISWKFNAIKTPFTVGLGFTSGYVDDFEPEAHDLPLDAILNDIGCIWPV